MKYLLILFCLQNILQISVCDLDSQWKDFKDKFNRSYFRNDDSIRKGIFASNLKYIEQHNEQFARGLKSFELGVNQFADLTNAEYIIENNLYETDTAMFENEIEISNMTLNITLPEEVNWVKSGYRTPVLHQGSCGSCYIFGAIEAVQGQYYIKTKKLIRLSHQEIVDCGAQTNVTGIHGCKGGVASRVLVYVKQEGINYNSDYPYTAKVSECKKLPKAPRVFITDYKRTEKGNEQALKEIVATVGVVAVSIDVTSRSFQLYKSGIYYEKNCHSIKHNHAVAVVGYGKTKNGIEYWVVKNSWGGKWGDKGYIKMSRNRNNNCGIAGNAWYPII